MDQTNETQAADRLSVKLESVARLLDAAVEETATQASEVLDSYPGQPLALALLLNALHLLGAESSERELLEWMIQEHPNLASIRFRLGVLLGRLGLASEAVVQLSRVVELEPNHPAAWLALGNQSAAGGDNIASAKAYARHIRLSLRELKLLEEASEGSHEDLKKAEGMLQQALALNPTDVAAIQALGKVMIRLGRPKEAETHLKRALELAPNSALVRHDYAMALNQLMDWRRARAQLDVLLEEFPDDLRMQSVKAGTLIMMGENEEGIRLLEQSKQDASGDVQYWLNYGHALRTVGRNNEAIEAYRKCIELDPAYGTAWWSLADLKTYHFSAGEAATLGAQTERDDISDGQRCHLEFAMGKLLEDAGDWAQSFEHYQKGNALRRPYIPYSADSADAETEELRTFFSAEYLRSHEGSGCPASDPIFIVGMPRSGSTLVEQILSSHSQVEGTMELPDLSNIVVELAMKPGVETKFPFLLSNCGPGDFRALGEEYLERTRCQRKLGRPFFTDKSGNNFFYTGLIRLILPNAKIIDVRRHPLACGFSCYKQAFAPGAIHFAYDQSDIARYYRGYIDMMEHFDRVMPGQVHRLFYEDIVRDPEREIRRLLEYCGLPFEEQCLRFHETDRSVRTSSSQQVRQPIQKKQVEAWQRYETWLQPMKDALGEVLTRYPDVPECGSPGS